MDLNTMDGRLRLKISSVLVESVQCGLSRSFVTWFRHDAWEEEIIWDTWWVYDDGGPRYATFVLVGMKFLMSTSLLCSYHRSLLFWPWLLNPLL